MAVSPSKSAAAGYDPCTWPPCGAAKNGEGHDLIHRPLAPELLPSSSGRVASHSADHRLWCTREKHVRSSGERRGFRGVLAFAVCFSVQKSRASDCRRVRSVWGSKGRGQSPVSGRRPPPLPPPSLTILKLEPRQCAFVTRPCAVRCCRSSAGFIKDTVVWGSAR